MSDLPRAKPDFVMIGPGAELSRLRDQVDKLEAQLAVAQAARARLQRVARCAQNLWDKDVQEGDGPAGIYHTVWEWKYLIDALEALADGDLAPGGAAGAEEA